jgi:hypothetical protein
MRNGLIILLFKYIPLVGDTVGLVVGTWDTTLITTNNNTIIIFIIDFTILIDLS